MASVVYHEEEASAVIKQAPEAGSYFDVCVTGCARTSRLLYL